MLQQHVLYRNIVNYSLSQNLIINTFISAKNGTNTTKSLIDAGWISRSTEYQSRSTSGIQALREAEREYHRSQTTLAVLRYHPLRRTTSSRSSQGRGVVRRRIMNSYKDKHQSTTRGIRWIPIHFSIKYIKFNVFIVIVVHKYMYDYSFSYQIRHQLSQIFRCTPVLINSLITTLS